MIRNKFNTVIVAVCACFVASSLNAATIPAGTTLTVTTVSLVTSQDVVGRSFEAKIAQDVSVNGNVLLKAGTKAFGKIRSSRANPRKIRAAHCGTDVRFGERTQRRGEDEQRPAGKPAPNSATGAVWTYRRHNGG